MCLITRYCALHLSTRALMYFQSTVGPHQVLLRELKRLWKNLQITWNKSSELSTILFHFWVRVESHPYVADQYYKPVCPSQTQRRLQWPPWNSWRPLGLWWLPTPAILKPSQSSNPGFVWSEMLYVVVSSCTWWRAVIFELLDDVQQSICFFFGQIR